MTLEIKEEAGFKYIENGSGEPLVLLHGLFGALSNFQDVIDHFKERYTVLVPLLPIYDLPVLETNVKKLQKFVTAFLDHKNLYQVNLLGNSLGGHIALVFSKNYPERVKRLILTGSSGLYENAMGGSFPRREDKTFIRNKVAETFYDPTLATDELVDECFEILNNRGKLIRILTLAKSAIRHNMAKDLPDFAMPVCLIWGKNDTITPPHVAEEFHELLPKSDLFWIDKCGHAAMMEHPKTFNELLDNWLNEH